MTTPFCILKDTLVITVQDGDAPQYEISDQQDICEGSSISLGGAAQTGTVYLWYSEPPGFASTDPDPVVTPADSIVYYLLASNLSCPFSSLDSVVVNVYPQPVLDVIADTSICQGEQVILGNTQIQEGMVYTWTPDDGSLDSIGLANPLATPEQSTLYTLIANNLACADTVSVQVDVVPVAIDLVGEDSLQLCQGASLTLEVAAAPNDLIVNWSPNLDLVVASDGLSAEATPNETITYTASVQAGACYREVKFYIAVDSLPENLDILPADTTVCAGSQVFLLSEIYEPAEYGGIEFEWSPVTGQLTPDSLYNMVIQATETTTYQRITTLGMCADTAEATVNVIPVADMSITPSDTTVCPGSPVGLQLMYTPGVTDIEWMPADGLSCSDCDNPTATLSGTTTISVNGDFMGCPVNTSVTINVTPPPTFQFPSDVQLCAGESILLNETSLPGTTYSWTSNPPGFTSNEPQPLVTPLQNTTYFVQANNGCSSTGQVAVTVSSGSLDVSTDTTICKNFTAQLEALGSLPGTYSWSTGQTSQVINVMPDETTEYIVTYTYGDNCVIMDTILVAVQGEGPEVNFPTDLKICPGESVQLNDLVIPGASYSWTSNPAGFNASVANPTVAPTTNTTYYLTATLGLCTLMDSVRIQASNPTLIMPMDTIICEGELITLTATVENPGPNSSFTWTPGGAGASIDEMPDETTMYQLVYTFGDSCMLEDSVLVTVVPTFTIEIISDPAGDTLSIGALLELSADIEPIQNLNGFEFVWTENGTLEIGMEQVLNTQVSTNDTTILYKVVVTSPAGCVQTENIEFTVIQPEVKVPNAFTPDGDGVNDVFRIIAPEGLAFIESMQIYNRWGSLVYESSDPNAAWDGKVKGKPAASDVYVYVIFWRRADGALQPVIKGDLTLIR
jgi:gliding motility-associated-like protein